MRGVGMIEAGNYKLQVYKGYAGKFLVRPSSDIEQRRAVVPLSRPFDGRDAINEPTGMYSRRVCLEVRLLRATTQNGKHKKGSRSCLFIEQISE